MKSKPLVIILGLMIPLLTGAGRPPGPGKTEDNKIISYIIDPGKQDLQIYWKDDSGRIIGTIQRLRDYLIRKHRRLVFAVNGGMFKADYSPVGLFIQDQKVITPIDTGSGEGNFYLKPNGVLYITSDNKAGICPTSDFALAGRVKFATQSGPLLLIDGRLHPSFKKGSSNLNIRNGVGLLSGNRLLFAMSAEPINFYDFASYFQNSGCQNALYLDGFVSRTYLPEQGWDHTDGNLGVMIGSTVAD